MIRLSLFLVLLPSVSFAATIRALVPDKDWAVSIEIDDFEPMDAALVPKTILAGDTPDGMVVTILVEKVKRGTTAASLRDKYGGTYARLSADPGAVEKKEIGETSIILYPRGSPKSSLLRSGAWAL